MKNETLLDIMALTAIDGIGPTLARVLLDKFVTIDQIFSQNTQDLQQLFGIGDQLSQRITKGKSLAYQRAEKEIDFIDRNNIEAISILDDKYPKRLALCPDAPLLIYYKGSAPLESQRVISIVGTRNMTKAGGDNCDNLVSYIAQQYPDVLIISGLAYGADICAHRACLSHSIATIGVLAHGLDRIYPLSHRDTAVEMVEKGGGLLTEFMSQTESIGANFVQRNRIVAALSDLTIVIESASKGGSLITADIANGYHREVMAFPGRLQDKYAQGCNQLIRDQKAAMICTPEDVPLHMGWSSRKSPISQLPQIPLDMTDQEQLLYAIINKNSPIHLDTLSLEADIPVYILASVLMEMELKKLIKTLPGGRYCL